MFYDSPSNTNKKMKQLYLFRLAFFFYIRLQMIANFSHADLILDFKIFNLFKFRNRIAKIYYQNIKKLFLIKQTSNIFYLFHLLN